MAYEKQNWDCGDTITAEKLNHMEDGIANGGGETMESITYAELKVKRDNGELTPGTQYRITDYECATTQEDSRVVAHSFDVIVVADDESTLNENARACLRDGDTYYSASNHDANLKAWELKYCIDNDTDRFAWTDTANGKGVIYWLKDEKDNECPYDFKQIQFKTSSNDGPGESETTATKWLYTFSVRDGEATEVVSNDASVSKQDITGCNTYGNIIRPYRGYQDRENGLGWIQYLNGITFDNLYNEWDGTWCRNNTFGDRCYDNTFGDRCYDNTFGDECYDNTFGGMCSNNTFGGNCSNNTFRDGCYDNTFGDMCSNNTFGGNCSNNTFGDGCYDNTFGDVCYDNTFGDVCYDNTFGDECALIDFFKGATTTDNRYYQVLSGTSGTDSSHLAINGTANNNYVTYIGKNSSGVLKIWIPADLVV